MEIVDHSLENKILLDPYLPASEAYVSSGTSYFFSKPLFHAVDDIYFDFNCGARVSFPDNGKKYHLYVVDTETDSLIFNSDVQPGFEYTSAKTYYVPYYIRISDEAGNIIFEHNFSLKNKDVIVVSSGSAIGDGIAWMSGIDLFQRKHNCICHCVLNNILIPIFEKQYPNIHFISQNETPDIKAYAIYTLGFCAEQKEDNTAINGKYISLHKHVDYVLGVHTTEEPPRVDLSAPRRIIGKYVVIATKASGIQKLWHNPNGWDRVIQWLKYHGYRVLCIDASRYTGMGLIGQGLPHGVEDFTGCLPLQERIDIIKDADFFIGLGSGLSWLAWCCKVPVVLISGFSHPISEFYTPYRIINYNVCNSCWNKFSMEQQSKTLSRCPVFDGTPRQYECSRAISSKHVINTIMQIPTFKPRPEFDSGCITVTQEEVASYEPRFMFTGEIDVGQLL